MGIRKSTRKVKKRDLTQKEKSKLILEENEETESDDEDFV